MAGAHQPVRRWVYPGSVGCAVALVAGAQGAGKYGLLFCFESFPACGRRGGVGGVAEVGQGTCQVGEWDAGQGGEVPGCTRSEDEFGGRWRAVGVEGDVGTIEELGQRQPVCPGEALYV